MEISVGKFKENLRAGLIECLSEVDESLSSDVMPAFDRAFGDVLANMIDGTEAPAPKPAKRKTRKPRPPRSNGQGDGDESSAAV